MGRAADRTLHAPAPRAPATTNRKRKGVKPDSDFDDDHDAAPRSNRRQGLKNAPVPRVQVPVPTKPLTAIDVLGSRSPTLHSDAGGSDSGPRAGLERSSASALSNASVPGLGAGAGDVGGGQGGYSDGWEEEKNDVARGRQGAPARVRVRSHTHTHTHTHTGICTHTHRYSASYAHTHRPDDA